MNRSASTRGIRLSAVIALLVGFLAVTQPVRANTYVVTNSNDSGAGSLRQAISDANNHAGADIITFATATNGIPIVLAGAVSENANAGGDLDILNNGDLTIQGNGAANTIIDGGGIDRVLHVCPGGGCTNSVTLQGVTIRNGSIGGYGGGIYNRGNLTVDNSIVSGNTAIKGGGIYNKAPLTIQNGSLIGGSGAGNTATGDGGGIYNETSLTTVDASTINGNTATGDGGGIYVEKGALIVDGGTVSGNAATNGGGIYNKATPLNIQNGSLIGGAGAGNTATANGGGIYHEAGEATIDGSTVSGNAATNGSFNKGGGIYNAATLHVQNGSLIGGSGAGNTADYSGGGIYSYIGSSVTVDDSTISANTSYYGGGIFNLGALTIQNGSTIGGIGASNTATAYGGGIYHYMNGSVTVTDSRILMNRGTNGGGVYIDHNTAGVIHVTGSCLVRNSATSFFNSQSAQQVATGNWWGAATGPNTPGADTVGGNVDASGYLTETILGCVFYDTYLPLTLKQTP